MLSKLASLTLCRSIQLLRLMAGGDAAKDLELLVLGHQRTVRRRQLPPPRLEPADRALLDPVSRVLPSSRWSCLVVQPETLLGWHRRLVAGAWTSPHRQRGRPPLDQDLQQLIVRLASENPTWGDLPSKGERPHLGVGVSATAIGATLGRHGRTPAPSEAPAPGGRCWATRPLGSSPATWFPVAMVGLGRLEVRCFIELDSRRVHLAGVTANPDGGGVPQPARNLLGVLGTTAGGVVAARRSGRQVLRQLQRGGRLRGGVVLVPGAGPHGLPSAEGWVGTVRTQCLNWLVLVGRSHLEPVLWVDVPHANGHRPHRALGRAGPDPPAGLTVVGEDHQGRVRRGDLLGGLLHEYRRAA